MSKNYKLFKRICDLTFALFLLIILIPLIILISILIIFFDGYPLFFKQLRVGKDEKVFQIYKFRTMRSYSKELSDSDLTFSDKYRISRFGSFLRKLSLDELPQLFNVIKGDMSFIGPRPLLIDYLSFYNSEQKQRHLVIPGISGLAQVNGRNSISWEERFKYDIYYVNNQNLFLDLKIIFLTFLKVIIMSNINDKKSVTMTPFKGEK